MAKTRISKIDAARRQVDAAISLHFAGGDLVAVHALAAAGGRILRDLCEIRRSPGHAQNVAIIRPGMEGKFWKALNTASDFFKHAGKDADEILEFDELANDSMIMLAIMSYVDLGHQLTPKMLAFHNWYSLIHPDFLPDVAREKLVLLGVSDCHTWSREDQVRAGRHLLEVSSSAR
jgi:hypothetical protein